MWLERLENNPLMAGDLDRATSTRDDYWKQGSVCEDYSAITAAVYAVGGWADGYSNAIPRLLAGLPAPRKGLIGPWAHAYPHVAMPGPRIGFLQEALRWWDHLAEGPRHRHHGRADAARLDAGKRAAGDHLCRAAGPLGRRSALAAARTGDRRSPSTWRGTASPNAPAPTATSIVASSLATGVTFGEWCPYGLAGELPADQRPDDGRSVVFDSRAARRTRWRSSARLS